MELGANQKIWVEALKSGKYSQCTNQLCYTDLQGNKSYCCLGVAVDLFQALIPSNTTNLCGSSYKTTLGLIGWNGDIEGTKNTLTMMNDNGQTFQQIAEFIELNPELVFSHSV